MISDSFFNSTAAMTHPPVTPLRVSGIDTWANKPEFVAHEGAPAAAVSQSSMLQRLQHLRRRFGFDWQAFDLSLGVPRHPSAGHVGGADQDRIRLAGTGQRAAENSRHLGGFVDLEIALRIERGNAVDCAFRPRHFRAERILHRVDQQGRLRAQEIVCVADIRATVRASTLPTDSTTSVPKLSARMAATGMRLRLSAGRVSRTGCVVESMPANVSTDG